MRRSPRRTGHADSPATEVDLERRKALAVGAALVSAKLFALAGCGGDASESGASGAPSSGGAGGGATGATGAGGSGAGGEWASGGTGAMAGDYPDPFDAPLGTACAITCAATLGPCYAETVERQDISEGYPGLPVRLALLVVDASCAPVEGAPVAVWHTSNQGRYSGDDAQPMCTGNDADAMAHRFFRGVQSTGADGRVDFDTCFPGWYPGRTVHIHFTVRVGGQEYVTSQLCFAQDLIAGVFSSHPDYAGFGQPDTSNASDSLYSPEGELETEKMQDGAMLAWKVLVLRSSLADALCSG